MPPAGFEPAIPSLELPQTHTVDPEAMGKGATKFNIQKSYNLSTQCVYVLCVALIYRRYLSFDRHCTLVLYRQNI